MHEIRGQKFLSIVKQTNSNEGLRSNFYVVAVATMALVPCANRQCGVNNDAIFEVGHFGSLFGIVAHRGKDG